MGQPLLPGLLRDVLVDALAELAGIGLVVEAIGGDAEQDAIDGTGHFFGVAPEGAPTGKI
ncbi:hypothetical protein D3C83_202470 [compost metagenome]